MSTPLTLPSFVHLNRTAEIGSRRRNFQYRSDALTDVLAPAAGVKGKTRFRIIVAACSVKGINRVVDADFENILAQALVNFQGVSLEILNLGRGRNVNGIQRILFLGRAENQIRNLRRG